MARHLARRLSRRRYPDERPLREAQSARQCCAIGRLREGPMARWVEACGVNEVELEGVIRLDNGDRTFAVYRSPDGDFFCTDGLCSHEAVHLADGFVMDYEIECPKHSGAFDYRTGVAKRLPPCINLRTFPVRVEQGRVLIEVA